MSITSEELNYLIWRYLQETGNELSALALQEETRVKEFDKLYKQYVPLGSLVNLVQRGILYSESELFVEQLGRHELLDLFKGSDSHAHSKLEEYINNRANRESSRIFNLANALKVDTESIPEFAKTGRFALVNDDIERDLKEKGCQVTNLNETDMSGSMTIEQSSAATSMTPATVIPTITSSNPITNVKIFEPNWNQSYIMEQRTNYVKWNPQRSNIIAFGIQNEAVTKIIQFNKDSKVDKYGIHELRHPFALSYTMGNTTNEITCLEWSNDGNCILTAVENGEIRLWSNNGLLKNVFNFHRVPIISIKWNYDDTLFLSMDIENVVILWNAINGTVIQHFELTKSNSGNIETSYNNVSAKNHNTSRSSNIDMDSSSSNYGVSTSNSNTINNNENVTMVRDNKVAVNGTEIAWVDKDKFVLPASNGKLNVYSIESKKPIGKLIGHEQVISDIKFNDSNKLLATSSDDLSIRVWHGSSSNSSHIFYGHTQDIISIEWINDNLIISCSLDGTIRIWSLKKQDMVAIQLCDGIPIICGKLSNNKRRYVVGLLDGKIRLFDLSYVLNECENEKNDTLRQPLTIPLCGEYSKIDKASNEENMVFDLSWNENDSEIAISYSNKPGVILSI